MITEFRDVFSSPKQEIGKTNLIEFDITLKPGSQPVKHKVHPLNLHQKEDLRKQARVVTNPMRCTYVEEIRSLKETSKDLLQLVDRGQGHDDEKSKTWEEQLAAVGIKEHKVANQSSDLHTAWNNRSRRATRVVSPRPPSMSSA